MNELWKEAVLETVRGVMLEVGAVLPNVLASLTLLVTGIVIGWLIRMIVIRLLRAVNFNTRCERWGIRPALARAGIIRPPDRLGGALVFWAIFLLFAMMGIDALALPGTGGATSVVVRLLPQLLMAGLLLLVGWLLANFLGHAVLIGAVNAGVRRARFLGQVVRWAVLFFTAGMVLTHLQIGKEMILLAFAILFGGLMLTFSLAFGLGGRETARRLLEERIGEEERAKDGIPHL